MEILYILFEVLSKVWCEEIAKKEMLPFLRYKNYIIIIFKDSSL